MDVPYRFEMDHQAEWLRYLDEQGYVVVTNVATQEEVARARELYWDCIEQTSPEVKRGNVQSWQHWKLDPRGIVLNGDMIHCRGAWMVRGLPRVKDVFCAIWRVDDVIVSMDSPLIWRPWWMHAKWKPLTEGLHLDQNPFRKPNKCCVQGMLPLYDVTDETGGLEVVPLSHTAPAKKTLKLNYSDWNDEGDFCMLHPTDPTVGMRMLLQANAGDLILWDSRTIHGGRVGTGKKNNTSELCRLSQTICMTPRSMATPNILAGRILAFQHGIGTSHWPHELHPTTRPIKGYAPIELTDGQRRLL